ncbi:MAG: T9SS type A sorting domain-containing protein, partial [Bacteroidia bacterium]|nr:T9SS type A sorting domain-containing protein [Bacteroidia bacterium]
ITELQLYEQKNTICQGTNVTFTATPTNGGAGPTYQWMLNDVNVGTNSTTYSTSGLADGDNVKCVLTSNAVCPTGNPATSTVTTVTVNVAPVGGSITGGSTICYGNTTETLTLSGKTGTVFKWQKRVDAGSWTDINNTADTYSEIPTSGGAWDYRVTVKSGVCPAANSSIVSVTVGKITGLVTANTTSNCTINSADETQWVYFSDNGNLICAVKDASGGGSMGASTAKVYIDGSVQSYNNNPYLQRIISITPTGGVPAKVRIYFTNTELTALKATRGEYASRTYTDLYVTKFSGDISAPTGSGISITPTAYLNNASVKAIHGIRPEWNNIYAVEFDVTSFSTFFLHFNPSPLPVELLQFKAECLDKGILLKWATASETNNNYFTLEKSSDAIYFNTIDTVEGAGNSHQTKEYSFIDKKQLYDGNIYYRLKQTDRDGKFKYSDIIASNCKEVLKDIIISPNPVNNELSIKIANNKTSLYFEIIGSNGAVVYKGSVTEKTTIPTNSFSSGVYLIKFENGNSLKFSKKD